MTVLFADLKGSMELLVDEGTVNQVIGDGIMAPFGAPLAHEDHAVRASYAALRMQEAVKRYAEGVQRTVG
jgi:class 3 adenylate cyclase